MSKQIFNALNGVELKKAILFEIEKEMDLSGEFRGHVTYPWVKFDAVVRVLSYPKQDMNAEPQTVATVEGEISTPLAVDFSVPVVEVAKVEIGKTVDTPDQARVESAQPLPLQATGAGGVQVDKPVARPVPAAPAKPGQVKPTQAAAPVVTKPTNVANRDAMNGSPMGIPGIDGSL